MLVQKKYGKENTHRGEGFLQSRPLPYVPLTSETGWPVRPHCWARCSATVAPAEYSVYKHCYPDRQEQAVARVGDWGRVHVFAGANTKRLPQRLLSPHSFWASRKNGPPEGKGTSLRKMTPPAGCGQPALRILPNLLSTNKKFPAFCRKAGIFVPYLLPLTCFIRSA